MTCYSKLRLKTWSSNKIVSVVSSDVVYTLKFLVAWCLSSLSRQCLGTTGCQRTGIHRVSNSSSSSATIQNFLKSEQPTICHRLCMCKMFYKIFLQNRLVSRWLCGMVLGFNSYQCLQSYRQI